MPANVTQYNEPASQVATIANGASLSNAQRLPPGHVLVGLIMPAAWTAAGITMQGSVDGVTYGNLYIAAGSEHALVVAAATTVILDPTLYLGVPFLKLRSGTAGTPVNQAAARTITLITRAL